MFVVKLSVNGCLSRNISSSVLDSAAAAPPPFRLGDPVLCGSRPLVTPYECRPGDLLCFLYVCALIVFFCSFSTLMLLVGSFDL